MAGLRIWMLVIFLVVFRLFLVLPGECVQGGKVVEFRSYGTPGETPHWVNLLRCKGENSKFSSSHENLKKIFEKSKHGGSMLAMISGDRSLISFDTKNRWRSSGLSHLLVISGQHLGILFGILLLGFVIFRHLFPFCFARLELYRWQGVILLPFVWWYLFWTGMSAGTLRAAVMLSIFFVTKAALVRMAFWQWGLLSLFLIIAVDPLSIVDPALHLSCSAVAGIILFMKWIRPYMWWKKWYVVTLGAILGVMPVAAYYFGVIPLFGWAASLMASPLMVVLLPMLALVVFFGEIGANSIALFLLTACDFFINIFEKLIISPISASNLSLVSLPVGGTPELLLMLLSVFGGGFLLSKRKLRFGIILFFISILLVFVLPSFRALLTKKPVSLQWTTFSVGQGESLLVRFPHGKTMLIDGGGKFNDYFDPGARLVVPALRKMGVRKIDYIVISHPDLDHIKGLFAVTRQIPVGEVWTASTVEHSALFGELVELFKRERTTILFSPPKRREIDGVRLSLSYPGDRFSSKNDKSLVVRMKYGKTSFLLTGDIEKKREYSMVKDFNEITSTVLKVPHHGSKNSSTVEFIKSVHPKFAIVSAGYNNPYHHPHPSVRQRYKNLGIPFLVTSEVGSIQVETDGISTKISCFSPIENRWDTACRKW